MNVVACPPLVGGASQNLRAQWKQFRLTLPSVPIGLLGILDSKSSAGKKTCREAWFCPDRRLGFVQAEQVSNCIGVGHEEGAL